MNILDLWSRFGDDSYTVEDLAMILDIVKDDENLQEFYEVSNRLRNNAPVETKDRQEAYRKEAAQLIARYGKTRKIQSRKISSSRNIRRFRKIWYAAAAVLLLGVLIPGAYFYLKPKTEQIAVQYVEEFTRRGEIKTVFLPDQTKVTLNADSRLTYPEVFTGERSVELCGEALFDVVSDGDRPFTVNTTDMKVSVLGTVFNVKAYANDEFLTVSVASGKVEVEQSVVETRYAASTVLKKDQQLRIDKITGDVEKLTTSADIYRAWTERTLHFHRTTIREVVNMLNRYYPHVDVELADGDYSGISISGKQNNKRIETVLASIMYSTGLQYKKSGSKIILYQP
jgi:ferric-dicitrate binding protein FerR (iron transport regulator)